MGAEGDRALEADEADRLHPGMRWLLWTVVVLALLAGIELFVLTDHTDRFFAWTISPPVTAAFLGATYWSASLMALLSVRTARWSSAQPMVVGIMAVTPLLLVVTLAHLSKFHMGTPYGIVWLIVYATLPVVTPVLIAMQLRTAPGPVRTAPIPRPIAWLMGILAAGLLVVGGVLLFGSSTAARFWPWPLATLSAQAIGSWFVAYGVTAAWVVAKGDLIRARSAAFAYAAFGLLGLIAVLRYPGSLDWSSARTVLFVGASAAAMAGGTVAAFLTMRAAKAHVPASAG